MLPLALLPTLILAAATAGAIVEPAVDADARPAPATPAVSTAPVTPVPVGSIVPPRSIKDVHAGKYPSDWFLRQRTWPHDDILQESRLAAHAQATALRSFARGTATGTWEPVGPTNIGGRVTDVACHPSDPSVVYIGAASGGVFGSTDTGATWTPLFDDQSSLSIGSLALDPADPNVIWVGTGEPNGGGGSVSYGGTGVFRSTNAGATWANLGLEDTRYIGRIRVDPADPSRVFVAALGAMWSTGPDRGVYRTTDTGATWQRVLASTDSTGAVDLLIDPVDSDRIYAVLWERTRGPSFLNYGGPTSGIHRSTDGGNTWTELTSGLPTGSRGRIGITQCASSPDVLYAIYAEASPGAFEGIFKSTNGGDTWTQTNDSGLSGMYSSFGWWFGNIRVDPNDANRVFALGLDFYRTTNGGASWSFAGGSMHVDHHGLAFASDGSLFEGNDGGMYRSTNGGTVWNKLSDLPNNQFYTVEIDEQFPLRRYGGLQDNGTQRTLTGGSSDWSSILGGDGLQCLVDPTNNQYVFAEYQYGTLFRSTNGGSSFSYIAGSLSGRKNWSMPIAFNPANPATIYAGTDRVYRSFNRGSSWTSLSGDLTDGSGGGNTTYGTLTTIAAAPSDPTVILIGTDDGNVWISTNDGANWTRVDAALPNRWITRVAFDPLDEAIGYVTVSGFRWDEPASHVFRTTDFGSTWADISSNLPEAPTNDVVVDPLDSATLYVGTDFGVYRTTDTGGSWHTLGVGLPNVVVNDLELHHGTRTLVAATYGRSMWTFDLTAAVHAAEGPLASADLRAPRLRPIRPNPAASEVVGIPFALPRAASVTLEVYDVAGRRVARLVNGTRAAGDHTVRWNRRDDSGESVGSGVYLIRLAGDGVTRTRKVVLLD